MHCENKRDIHRNDYNHMNNLIFLEDEKYDIKGLYLLDATHDNHNYEDFFVLNHFLVTPDKFDTHIMKMYAAGYSLLTVKEKDFFIEILKNDEFSLSSLISILSLYYKDYDLFGVSFDDEEGRLSYYLERAETLYELDQNITIEQVSQEKLEKALIHIEKIKNPSITIEELTEKVDKTFEVYQERNDRIYDYQKVKTNK